MPFSLPVTIIQYNDGRVVLDRNMSDGASACFYCGTYALLALFFVSLKNEFLHAPRPVCEDCGLKCCPKDLCYAP